MHINCINIPDHSDGWWESIRLKDQIEPDLWQFLTTTTRNEQDDVGEMVFSPMANYANVALSTRSLIDSDSYSTGSIRDLHKIRFVSQPLGDDHEFSEMQEKYTMQTKHTSTNFTESDSQGEILADFDKKRLKLNQNSANTRLMHDAMLDNNHDMIYIRIYARANTAYPTRLVFHEVHNVEVKFNQGTSEARFHSASESTASQAYIGMNAIKRKETKA